MHRRFLINFIYIFTNYFISNIPCWIIRKHLYRMCGMKIGKGARIMMKVTVVYPWKIAIGNRSIINEYCYLDGRGGLLIESDCSISIYTTIITASHSMNSDDFAYREGSVVIRHHAWTGARAMVLDKSSIGAYAVISAGSVVKGDVEAYGVYNGVPAVLVAKRAHVADYRLQWSPFFR